MDPREHGRPADRLADNGKMGHFHNLTKGPPTRRILRKTRVESTGRSSQNEINHLGHSMRMNSEYARAG